jgi:hypothetical protein
VVYPFHLIGQFVSRPQSSLNAEEYCTPPGCGCRNPRFYKYATPLWGEEDFSHPLKLWVFENYGFGVADSLTASINISAELRLLSKATLNPLLIRSLPLTIDSAPVSTSVTL